LNCYEQQQIELDYLVEDIHSHYPSQGYRSIADTLLNQYGLAVSDISVFKSMKRLGINGFTRKQKVPTTTGAEHNRYPNILNRNFHSDKPLQKLVTDVTYIKNKGKWYYLACYLDLFNNEIVDWELSDVFDNFLVMKPAKRILEKQKILTPLSFYTAIRVFSIHLQVIQTCLNLTTLFKVCQEQELQEIMLLWNLSLDDLRTLCHRTLNIGNVMIYTKLLQIPFTILITLDLFEN